MVSRSILRRLGAAWCQLCVFPCFSLSGLSNQRVWWLSNGGCMFFRVLSMRSLTFGKWVKTSTASAPKTFNCCSVGETSVAVGSESTKRYVMLFWSDLAVTAFSSFSAWFFFHQECRQLRKERSRKESVWQEMKRKNTPNSSFFSNSKKMSRCLGVLCFYSSLVGLDRGAPPAEPTRVHASRAAEEQRQSEKTSRWGIGVLRVFLSFFLFFKWLLVILSGFLWYVCTWQGLFFLRVFDGFRFFVCTAFLKVRALRGCLKIF